ncbi:MAG: thiamine phosphate synthase [Planctomycetota bacterium]
MEFLDARLYLLFTPSLCRADPAETLRRAIEGGVQLVQWRAAAPDPAGLAICREICSEFEIPLIVDDDVRLAVDIGAEGAHVGQQDMPAAEARKLLEDRWLGVSTHDLGQIERAILDGADYLGFGPCFPTRTKGYARGLGPLAAARASAASRIPVFAIGGIDRKNAAALAAEGVRRIAVSSAILCAEDPGEEAAALRALLDA